MSFLKKLFGSQANNKPYVDKNGIYFHVRCDKCGSVVKLRIDKQHDLNNAGSNYVWHKTIVDAKCFHQIRAVVHFDKNYQVIKSEIEGGQQITNEEYTASLNLP